MLVRLSVCFIRNWRKEHYCLLRCRKHSGRTDCSNGFCANPSNKYINIAVRGSLLFTTNVKYPRIGRPNKPTNSEIDGNPAEIPEGHHTSRAQLSFVNRQSASVYFQSAIEIRILWANVEKSCLQRPKVKQLCRARKKGNEKSDK